MRFRNLDLNLLVALDLLLRERNVSRAAEKMHMTQSAMSNALARLRDYFDDDLLVPVGRRMELTSRAEQLREPVRDVLVRIETSLTATPEFDPAASERTFRIFVSDYSLTTVVPRFLELIAPQRYPIRFEFRPQTDQPQRTLDSGEADLLIIPGDFAPPDHPSSVFLEEGFVCLVANGHPRIGDRLSVEDFQRERHAVMQPPGSATSYETLAIRRQGIERDIDVTTFSFASLPWLIAGTERIATVHERLGRQAARALPVRVLPLPFESPRMSQAMQWHRYRSSDPALRWLREMFAQAAETLDEV